MSVRQQIIDYSKGDHLGLFWRLFAWRSRTASRRLRAVQTFFLNRSARAARWLHRAKTLPLPGRPMLPHGLHGIYISRYARMVRIAASIKTLPGEVGPRRRRDRGSLPDWRRSGAGRRYYCG